MDWIQLCLDNHYNWPSWQSLGNTCLVFLGVYAQIDDGAYRQVDSRMAHCSILDTILDEHEKWIGASKLFAVAACDRVCRRSRVVIVPR